MATSADKIPGYRSLNEREVELINEIKQLEARWNSLIDRLKVAPSIDPRQVAIAQTEGESAFMRAVRAVAQPERLVA